MSGLKVLICGDRNWTSHEPVRAVLERLARQGFDAVIHGNAKGVDRIAGYEARKLGMKINVYPADWRKYGRAAGMIRNREMIEKGKPDLVIGFHDNIMESKGTKDCLVQATRKGIMTILMEKGDIKQCHNGTK